LSRHREQTIVKLKIFISASAIQNTIARKKLY